MIYYGSANSAFLRGLLQTFSLYRFGRLYDSLFIILKIFILHLFNRVLSFRAMEDVRTQIKMRLPAIVLLAATFLIWPSIDPCILAGAPLLDGPALADADLVHGRCAESNSVITLTQLEHRDPPRVLFSLGDVSAYSLIRLSGFLQASEVTNRHGGHSVALKLIGKTAAGTPVRGVSHSLTANDQLDRSFFLQDYVLGASVVEADVELSRYDSIGTAGFDSVRAEPMKFNPARPVIRWGFMGAWFALGIFYFRVCRLHERKLRHLIFLNVVIILIGVMLPTHWIQYGPAFLRVFSDTAVFDGVPMVQTPVTSGMVSAGPGAGLVQHFGYIIGRSLGHFVLFGSLTFLVLLSGALEGKSNDHALRVVFDVLLFGAITEALQFFAIERTVDLADMLCNAYGVFTAVMVFMILKKIGSSCGWTTFGKIS